MVHVFASVAISTGLGKVSVLIMVAVSVNFLGHGNDLGTGVDHGSGLGKVSVSVMVAVSGTFLGHGSGLKARKMLNYIGARSEWIVLFERS